MTRIHPTNISVHTCRGRVVDLLPFELTLTTLRPASRRQPFVQNSAGERSLLYLGWKRQCEGEGARRRPCGGVYCSADAVHGCGSTGSGISRWSHESSYRKRPAQGRRIESIRTSTNPLTRLSGRPKTRSNVLQRTKSASNEQKKRANRSRWLTSQPPMTP